jgi:hypothetical protein
MRLNLLGSWLFGPIAYSHKTVYQHLAFGGHALADHC